MQSDAEISIGFVYFDLGNVLVHFDPDVACLQVARLLDSDVPTIRKAMYDSGIELQLEQGRITEDQFLDQLFAIVGNEVEQSERAAVLEAMSAMFRLNSTIQPVVDELSQQGMPMGILSNTCGPHWRWIVRQNYEVIGRIGTPTILSYEVGALKPDPQIYAAAQQASGVSHREILFIDDRLENVQAARDCGWQAVHYTDTPSLISELESVGLRISR